MSSRQPTPSRAQFTDDLSTAGRSSDHKGMLMAAVVMVIVGWGGLAQLIMTARPRIGGEIWLFFILLQIAVTGTAIPIVRYLSMRFRPALAPPLAGVIVRRSVWIGIMAAACAWLLIPRALSLSFVLILLLMFVVIEIFLRNREPTDER